MSNENPTFQIPKDVIEPIIQAHVSTAVTAALAGRDTLISKAVERALFAKVSSDGKSGGYYDKIPWIEWAMNDCIQKATIQAIQEELPKHKEKIKEALAKELGLNQRKLSPFAKKLIEGLVNFATDNDKIRYHLTVDVQKSSY